MVHWRPANGCGANCPTRNCVVTAYFQKKTFADISSLTIEKFKRDRLKLLKPSSVNRELAVLSKIFRLAIQKKITNENPVSQVKKLVENNARTRFLTPDEEARLLDAHLLNPTLPAIVVLALHTGMRKGEILKLEWRDVDFSRNLIYVRETKSDHDRKVLLNAVARAALEDLPHPKAAAGFSPAMAAPAIWSKLKKLGRLRSNRSALRTFIFTICATPPDLDWPPPARIPTPSRSF
jgi:integrase